MYSFVVVDRPHGCTEHPGCVLAGSPRGPAIRLLPNPQIITTLLPSAILSRFTSEEWGNKNGIQRTHQCVCLFYFESRRPILFGRLFPDLFIGEQDMFIGQQR
jgi:hypothetical protein